MYYTVRHTVCIALLFLFFVFPIQTHAAISITEIMYDPQSSEGEWVEVYNDGEESVDLKNWKLYDGVNHTIPAGVTIPPKGFIILADNKTSFVSVYPSLASSVFDIVTSLNNDGETLVGLRDTLSSDISTMSYTGAAGANKNGKTLQKVGALWAPDTATPLALSLLTETDARTLIEAAKSTSTTTTTPSSSSDSGVNAQTTSNTSGGYRPWPESYQIYVSAGGNRKVVVGAPNLFEGKLISSAGIAIPTATLSWAFGDGAEDAGRSVYHTFAYTGDYVVRLQATHGEFFAEDKIIVTAILPAIEISDVSIEGSPYIELHNTSPYDIDMSGWILQVDGVLGRHFIIPKYTTILAHKKVIFPSTITKLYPQTKETRLLFPNTTLLTAYGTSKDIGIATSTTAPSVGPIAGNEEKETEASSSAPIFLAGRSGEGAESGKPLETPKGIATTSATGGEAALADTPADALVGREGAEKQPVSSIAAVGAATGWSTEGTGPFIFLLLLCVGIVVYLASYLEKQEKKKEKDDITIVE